MAERKATKDPRALELARRVKELREERGWSQEQLAIKAKIDRHTVVNIERSWAAQPGVYNVDALARAFGITVEKLLTGRDPNLEERFDSILEDFSRDATVAVNALARILGWRRGPRSNRGPGDQAEA